MGRALSLTSCGQTQETHLNHQLSQEGNMSVLYVGFEEDTRSQSSMRSSYAEVNRF